MKIQLQWWNGDGYEYSQEYEVQYAEKGIQKIIEEVKAKEDFTVEDFEHALTEADIRWIPIEEAKIFDF